MSGRPYFASIYVRWHTRGMSGETAAPAIAGLLGDVAELMLADLDQLGGEMDAAVFELAPALRADAAIALEVSASNRANVARVLTVLARRDGRPPPRDVPPEALDVVRTVVRRGSASWPMPAVSSRRARSSCSCWRRPPSSCSTTSTT